MLSDTEINCVAIALAVCLKRKEEKKKRKWIKDLFKKRNRYTHENLLSELRLSEPRDFRNFLRLDSAPFDEQLEKVTPEIVKNTTMRDAIPSSQRLPITLGYLATGNTFEDLKFTSAISPQSIGSIVMKTRTALINSPKDYIKSVHELTSLRLPLQPYTGGHAVFMYSTAADGNVTLQLKEPDDLDRSSLAAMLARLQDDASFSISYQDTDILSDGSIDVLLGTGTGNVQTQGGNEAVTATFDLFDSSNGPDLTLSPQTFTNSTEAFINDNSNSLGVPADSEAVSSTDEKKTTGTAEAAKLTVKRARPKAASPNRQGPQQCQVCSKVFGNASALAKHKLTHSDERKYVCTMCGKAFKRQDHLNGHMLTHRNKKPYECKAEGCGKSYCDARSLRRHTENHHSSNASSTNTTMSPAQGAASGDAASPHGSSCIQYAPAPSTPGGKSQLQQLLATEPATNGGSNDGLTKQRLDLIHQIMEQSQRQSQSITKSNSKSSSKPASKSSVKVQKVWTSTAQQNSSNKTSVSSSSPQSKVTSTTSSNNSSTGAGKNEPKPVECNLCHRKFKNIPALNGHMRLHGGYFKKDADNKKCEKKDSGGPPLQTASVSIRALIEEKIINKRNVNPLQSSPSEETPTSRTSAPPLFPLTVHSPATGNNSNPDADSKTNSFAVPAPPQHATDKARRHSDAEAFTVPRIPNNNNSTQQEAEALVDLILKREKVTVKRTTSDPGQSSQIIQFQSGDSFTLAGVAYQSEDGDYLSPSLQDEVFTQVQDTMLLQGVDAQQLASIQFQTESLLQEHTEQQLQELTLEDYTQTTHSVNQDLQAVLDSPLPESLAEFSAFHSSGSLDLPSPNYQTQSPAQYAGSPHTSLAAQSPLQSPLVRHDSPAYTYPTPPASHEGQSPCFGQNTLLPMVSPKQNDYITRELDQIDQNPQASLLSAEFFSSTMSSSAAVEEALEEVLPGENIAADDLYPSLTNSPPPQSPLSIGLTPVPSPLSNIPNTSVTSPHTQTNFVSSPGNIQFSHYTFQSHMMPNSDDPLLSSSPKDFQAKKRFEFNGLPLKVIGNGILDANFTGILLDSNGEIKFIQTGGAFQAKNILLTTPHIVTTQTIQRTEDDIRRQQKQQSKAIATPPKQPQQQKPKVEQVKQEENNDVFLSPTTITASSVKNPRKRPRAEPLQLPILHQSRLRATRSKPQGSARFTPLPILNPTRQGTGLYWNLKQRQSTEHVDSQETNNWNEPVPESDSTPHINIGPQFQCKIPPCNQDNKHAHKPHREDLLWDPGISSSTDSEIDMYLDFACCAAIPGGGRNKEYAMHILHLTGGNIHEAMLKLMQPMPSLPCDSPLHYYHYSESDRWTVTETEVFHQALLKHDKDFAAIAQEVETKTIKQCIQFYYVWKKVCMDEYKRQKQLREKKSGFVKFAENEQEEKPYPDAKLLGIADSGSPIQDHRNFICEFTDCSASFNSRAALNGHIRIHGGTARNSPTYTNVSHDRRLPSVTSSLCHSTDPTEDYPCKICGKVFTKIKSRSAHMKSHRPPDAEPIKRKEKDVVVSSNFDASVPSPFST